MSAIFSYGILFAVSIVLGLICCVIGLFFGNIIFFDSIFFSIIAGISCSQLTDIHPAFCLLIGIGLFFLLFLLQNTRAGFWIIGILVSAFWALIFSVFVYDATDKDPIWTYVSMGILFVLMILLHLHARKENEN